MNQVQMPKNIEKCKAALMAEFRDVFDSSGPLRIIAGPDVRIELLDGAVPFAQREEVKAALYKYSRYTRYSRDHSAG